MHSRVPYHTKLPHRYSYKRFMDDLLPVSPIRPFRPTGAPAFFRPHFFFSHLLTVSTCLHSTPITCSRSASAASGSTHMASTSTSCRA